METEDYENESEEYNTQSQQSLTQSPKIEQLLTLTAISGEFPYDTFERLNIREVYAKSLRQRLKKDGIIQPIIENGLKGIRLTQKGLNRLQKENYGRYRYVSGKSRTDINRRIRNQLYAKTYCSLLNAGIEFLCDRKPYIYNVSRNQSCEVAPRFLIDADILDYEPKFYASTEIKYELEDRVQQIRNSAMMGLILSYDETYVLYNADNNRTQFSYATELKTNMLVTSGLFLSSAYRLNGISTAIVLCKDFESIKDLVFGNKEKKVRPCPLLIHNTFKHIYFVPESADGDVELASICFSEIREEIWDLFRENFGEPHNNFIVENDGLDDERNPALFCFFLEFDKILRFKRGLLAHDITGRVVCFDFQIDFLAEIMKPAKIKFNHIDIQEVRELMED